MINHNEREMLEQRVEALETKVAALQNQVEELRCAARLSPPQTPADVPVDDSVEVPGVVPVEAPEIVSDGVSDAIPDEVRDDVVPDSIPDNTPVEVLEEKPEVEQEIETPVAPIEEVSEKEPRRRSSLETFIGRNIFPIAGSVLVFIALVLFGSLIQPRLSDEMKAVLMAVVSVAFAAFGLIKMKREGRYYKLFAALAGCGVGACYITALVSHFALGVLSESGLMITILAWIAVVLALSYYKSRMFTHISYAGIVVATIMGAVQWSESLLGLGVYLVSMGVLVAINISRDYGRIRWMCIQLPFVFMLLDVLYMNHTNCQAQYLMLGVVLAAYVAQLVYYHKFTEAGRLLPVMVGTMACTAVIYGTLTSSLLLSLIVTACLVVINVLLYRIYRPTDSIGNQSILSSEVHFYLFFLLSTPMLWWLSTDYGIWYARYIGTFLPLVLVMFALGLLLHNRIFRGAGYVMMLLFAVKAPEAWSPELMCCVYLVVTLVTYLLMRRQSMMVDKFAIAGLLAVAPMLPTYYGMAWFADYVSPELPYAVLMFLYGCRYQTFSLFRIMAYVVLTRWAFFPPVLLPHWASCAVYVAAVASAAVWHSRNYHSQDRCSLLPMSLLACFLFMVHNYCTLPVVLLPVCAIMWTVGKPWFATHPLTGEEEKSVVCSRYFSNALLLIASIYYLRSYTSPLCIGHDIAGTETVALVLLILEVLLLSMLNLKRSYSDYANEPVLSIYHGLKFSIVLWVILDRLSAVNYIVSIVGILFSIVCVVVGFRRALKGARLYGLGLSIVCVLKLIFSDIVFDNEYSRPISFLIAGILLFVISYIYFRIEKSGRK